MMRSRRLERFLARHSILDRSVVHRHSDPTVQRWLKDPYFPLLVSFPRTGSHHLRLLMELYFELPSLPRIFHFKKAKSFTCCHVHDLIPPDVPAGIQRKRVVYLYRDPIPTVHSVLRYYDENPMDQERVAHWSEVYRKHLRKWLLEERSSEEKVLLHYDSFQKSPWEEFQELCELFGAKKDPERFNALFQKASVERVREKTEDAPAIIGDREERKKERERFHREAGEKVRELVFGKDPELRRFFSGRA